MYTISGRSFYNQEVLGISNETKTHSAAQFGDSAIQNE